MTAYDESLRPRDPLGKFATKSGPASTGVSLELPPEGERYLDLKVAEREAREQLIEQLADAFDNYRKASGTDTFEQYEEISKGIERFEKKVFDWRATHLDEVYTRSEVSQMNDFFRETKAPGMKHVHPVNKQAWEST